MEIRRAKTCGESLAILRSIHKTQWRSLGQPAFLNTRRNINTTPTSRPSRQTSSPTAHRRHERSYATATTTPVDIKTPKNLSPSDLNAIHARVQELAASALKPQDGPVPPEQRVLYVLEQLDSLAKNLVDAKSIHAASQQQKHGDSARSALLGSVNARQAPNSVTKATLLTLISQQAEKIARDQNVFITPAILKAYVDLQALLHQPSSLPDVFALYAYKPTPTASSDGTVTYSPATPDKINTAVDTSTANAALSSAITAHNLILATDIIETTFCTPSFRKAKVLRQALVPIGGLGLAPLAAYSLASAFGTWQPMLDPTQATWMAFAGIMTYVSAVSMTGYVAITTANDQMDRITWAQGVPLWERWVREDERAAVDRVAGAWGFKSLEKRGEEEGEDWEDLREWVGRRGMVLDRVELMDGME